MLLHPHQQHWKENFNKIKAVLESALKGLNTSIEHIGSTAVPHLAAKAIIDIDIVFDNLDEIKMRLEQIGYYHNGNQGIKDREVFKRIRAIDQHLILDSIKHHLYVCPSHSEELKRHLIFRDILIQNENIRKEYEAIKYEIAAATNQDKKQYAQLKEVRAKTFILSVISRGQQE